MKDYNSYLFLKGKKNIATFIFLFFESIIFYLGGKLTLYLLNYLSTTCPQKHCILSQLSMLSILMFYDFAVVV